MDKLEPVRYEHGRPMLLGGIRRFHPFAEAEYDIPGQWQEFRHIFPPAGNAIVYGVMCGETPEGFEYMCGIEVGSFAELPGNLGRMRLLEQYYAVFLHRGHVSTLWKTWERAWKEWLPDSEYRSAQKPDFEVYNRRKFNPDTGLGDIEIWLSIIHKTDS